MKVFKEKQLLEFFQLLLMANLPGKGIVKVILDGKSKVEFSNAGRIGLQGHSLR